MIATQVWWYTTRSSGIVAWALLTFSVFWGLALSSRFLGKKPKPNWMLDLHRFAGGLATVFTLVHMAALVLDTFVVYGLVELLVPFTADEHPAAVAWGIVAMYLLVAVEVTSLLRKKMSKRTWRLTHYLSFPLFALATVHLLLVGTDRQSVALRAGVLLGVATVTIATLARIVQADRKDAAVRLT